MRFHLIKVLIIHSTLIILTPSIGWSTENTTQTNIWPTLEAWLSGNSSPNEDTVQTSAEPEDETEQSATTSAIITDTTIDNQQSQLLANADSLSTPISQPVLIQPLLNDIAFSGTGIIQILIQSPPEFGQAELQANNTILYSPNPEFIGFDSFSYTLTDGSNQRSTTNINVSVENVTHCAYTVGLSWLKSANASKVAGFYIYHGTESGKYLNKEFVGHVYEYDYCANEPGVHYFAATTKDIYGRESELANEVKAIILE